MAVSCVKSARTTGYSMHLNPHGTLEGLGRHAQVRGTRGSTSQGQARAFRLVTYSRPHFFGHAGHSEVSLCGPAEAQLAGRTVAGRFLRTTARIGALSSAKLVSIVSRPHSRRLMLFLSPYGVINATCGSTITGLKQQRGGNSILTTSIDIMGASFALGVQGIAYYTYIRIY